MDAIEKASDFRHDLIHGFVVQHAEKSGEAELIRLLHHPSQPTQKKQFKVTTRQILQAAVDANKLATRSLNLGTGLQDLVVILTKNPD